MTNLNKTEIENILNNVKEIKGFFHTANKERKEQIHKKMDTIDTEKSKRLREFTNTLENEYKNTLEIYRTELNNLLTIEKNINSKIRELDKYQGVYNFLRENPSLKPLQKENIKVYDGRYFELLQEIEEKDFKIFIGILENNNKVNKYSLVVFGNDIYKSLELPYTKDYKRDHLRVSYTAEEYHNFNITIELDTYPELKPLQKAYNELNKNSKITKLINKKFLEVLNYKRQLIEEYKTLIQNEDFKHFILNSKLNYILNNYSSSIYRDDFLNSEDERTKHIVEEFFYLCDELNLNYKEVLENNKKSW